MARPSSTSCGASCWDSPCGQRQEHDVEPAEGGRVERDVLEARVGGAERRVQRSHRRARVRVGGDVHDVDVGVPGEQPQQLGPRVA